MTVPLKSVAHVSADSVGRERKMRLLNFTRSSSSVYAHI